MARDVSTERRERERAVLTCMRGSSARAGAQDSTPRAIAFLQRGAAISSTGPRASPLS